MYALLVGSVRQKSRKAETMQLQTQRAPPLPQGPRRKRATLGADWAGGLPPPTVGLRKASLRPWEGVAEAPLRPQRSTPPRRTLPPASASRGSTRRPFATSVLLGAFAPTGASKLRAAAVAIAIAREPGESVPVPQDGGFQLEMMMPTVTER